MPELPTQRDFDDFSAWTGRDVLAPDGERLGAVELIFLDEATGVPEWVLVALGEADAQRPRPARGRERRGGLDPRRAGPRAHRRARRGSRSRTRSPSPSAAGSTSTTASRTPRRSPPPSCPRAPRRRRRGAPAPAQVRRRPGPGRRADDAAGDRAATRPAPTAREPAGRHGDTPGRGHRPARRPPRPPIAPPAAARRSRPRAASRPSGRREESGGPLALLNAAAGAADHARGRDRRADRAAGAAQRGA